MERSRNPEDITDVYVKLLGENCGKRLKKNRSDLKINNHI